MRAGARRLVPRQGARGAEQGCVREDAGGQRALGTCFRAKVEFARRHGPIAVRVIDDRERRVAERVVERIARDPHDHVHPAARLDPRRPDEGDDRPGALVGHLAGDRLQ